MGSCVSRSALMKMTTEMWADRSSLFEDACFSFDNRDSTPDESDADRVVVKAGVGAREASSAE